MEFSKRKYTRRFTYSEKLAFLDVVVRHVGVIERRTKDKDTSRLKREAWAKIDEEFAAASGVRDRESVSLRTLWENLKRMAKSKTANGLNGAGIHPTCTRSSPRGSYESWESSKS